MLSVRRMSCGRVFPQQKRHYPGSWDRGWGGGRFFAQLRYLTISAGFPNLPPHSKQPPPSSPLDGAMDDSGIVAQPRHSRGRKPDPRRAIDFKSSGAAADERFPSVGPRPFPSSPKAQAAERGTTIPRQAIRAYGYDVHMCKACMRSLRLRPKRTTRNSYVVCVGDAIVAYTIQRLSDRRGNSPAWMVEAHKSIRRMAWHEGADEGRGSLR